MKIVHLCLGCFFPDHYSYQENMLPKFHKEMGEDVEVIASLMTFDKDGNDTFLTKGSTYQNEYGIMVTRLDYRRPLKVYRKMKRYIGTMEALEKARPNILFIHGCQFMDMDIVVEYLKVHKDVRVYVDNHADFSNSGTNFFSRNILHRGFWRRNAQMVEPYTTKFYGVLPARVDWLINMYGLPKDKVDLLVMGADDELADRARAEHRGEMIRQKYHIDERDFLVVTGGKIDSAKRQTMYLLEAVQRSKQSNVKLLYFGSIEDDLKEQVMSLTDGSTIQYAGWISAEESYDYFEAADLVCFPGRHSVFWEQAAGQGKPLLVKYWEGTTHVDVGGNVQFLRQDSTQEIQQMIERLMTRGEAYQDMLQVAKAKGTTSFSYREIAKRAIGI